MADLEAEVTDTDFDSGYAGATPPAVPEKVEPKTDTTTTAINIPTGGTGSAPVVVPQEYVQLTKEEHAAFRAATTKFDGIEKLIKESVAGTLGNVEQRLIKKLGITPPAEVKPPATPEEIEQDRWQRMVHEASVKYQIEALEEEHPTWRNIVGQKEDGSIDKATPFRVWLAAQPADYQARIENSNSGTVITRAITKFNEFTAAAKKAPTTTPNPKDVARKNVIRDAQQPRGDGGQPAPAKTDDDAFAEGFASG
jgi:hypothetical protein